MLSCNFILKSYWIEYLGDSYVQHVVLEGKPVSFTPLYYLFDHIKHFTSRYFDFRYTITYLSILTPIFQIKCQKPIEKTTADSVTNILDEVVRQLKIESNYMLLLLSDAAAYIKSAGEMLKIIYPRMFLLTCLCHSLHNV